MDDGVDGLFRSLGDSGRRRVARILAEAPLSVGEIAEVLGLPQSTVSRHLKTLRATGLLVERREGSRHYIGLAEPPANGNGDLAGVLNAWIRRQTLSRPVLDRLQRTIENRESQADGFEGLAHRWDELRFEHFGGLFHLEAIAGLLPADWRVLDIGTGTGYLVPFLARQFKDVIAVDPSPAMLELASQRAERERLGDVRFELGRAEELPVPDASIDCALAVLVLRYSQDLRRSAGELARVLVPDGRALIVDVVPHSMDEFRRRLGDPSRGLDPRKTERELERAGFEILTRRPVPPPHTGHPAAPTRPAPELFLIAARRLGPGPARANSKKQGRKGHAPED